VQSVDSWFEQVRELARQHRHITLDDVGPLALIIKREVFLERQAAAFGFRVRLAWDAKQQAYHIRGLLG
jgi:hypothetical protein